MNLLLDTHTLLWWLDEFAKLSAKADAAIRDGENRIYVSAASTLEIAIKKSLGKLDSPDNLLELIEHHRFQSLPITIPHTMEIATMPKVHSDPFDRLLAAQAKHERFTLVTRDKQLLDYPIKTLEA
jgi:PIN domain nuclease of toxin-antitoxin system